MSDPPPCPGRPRFPRIVPCPSRPSRCCTTSSRSAPLRPRCCPPPTGGIAPLRSGRATAHGLFHADLRVLSGCRLEVGGAEPAHLATDLTGAGEATFTYLADTVAGSGVDRLLRLDRFRSVTPGTADRDPAAHLRAGAGDEHRGPARAGQRPHADGGDQGRPTRRAGHLRGRTRAEPASPSAAPRSRPACTPRVPPISRTDRQHLPAAQLAGDHPGRRGGRAGLAGGGDRQRRRGGARRRHRAGRRSHHRAPDRRRPRGHRSAGGSLAAPVPARSERPADGHRRRPRRRLLRRRVALVLHALRPGQPVDVAAAAARRRAPGRRHAAHAGSAGRHRGRRGHRRRSRARSCTSCGAGRTRSTSVSLPPLYYGTIDATPLWICLLHDAWRAGLDEAEVTALLPVLEGALQWLVTYGDADGDGFLEYIDASGHGLANQGWKDSGDSVRFADGRIAEGPVALCEVQGYAYEAAIGGAALLEAFGRDGRRALPRLGRRRWPRSSGPPSGAARATNGSPRWRWTAPSSGSTRVTSNIGHLLGTGLLDAEEERAGGPPGGGCPTSTPASGCGPCPIADGGVQPAQLPLRHRLAARHGDRDRRSGPAPATPSWRTVWPRGCCAASLAFDRRLPELWSGEGRPVPYPAACRPQAWSAAAAVVVAEHVRGRSGRG